MARIIWFEKFWFSRFALMWLSTESSKSYSSTLVKLLKGRAVSKGSFGIIVLLACFDFLPITQRFWQTASSVPALWHIHLIVSQLIYMGATLSPRWARTGPVQVASARYWASSGTLCGSYKSGQCAASSASLHISRPRANLCISMCVHTHMHTDACAGVT